MAKFNLGRSLFKIFDFWTKIQFNYDIIKKDEEKRKKSVRFGVTSIILCIIGCALTVGSAIGFYCCLIKLFDEYFLFKFVGMMFCFSLTIIAFVRLVLGSLFYAIYQVRLNKRAVGWIAFIVFILCVALSVVGVIMVLNSLKNINWY